MQIGDCRTRKRFCDFDGCLICEHSSLNMATYRHRWTEQYLTNLSSKTEQTIPVDRPITCRRIVQQPSQQQASGAVWCTDHHSAPTHHAFITQIHTTIGLYSPKASILNTVI